MPRIIGSSVVLSYVLRTFVLIISSTINRPVNAALYMSLVLNIPIPRYSYLISIAGHGRADMAYIYRINLLSVGQPLSDGGDILLLMDLDDPIDLGSAAHQFHRTGVHHPLRRIAVNGKVVEEDVGD